MAQDSVATRTSESTAGDKTAAGVSAPEIAIVVPTFNEAENVAEVVRRVDAAMTGMRWEIVFVDDDSPDGTSAALRDMARRDPRVRVLRRIGRRGLSTACIEGMLATAAPYLAVMDADLQHDETRLPDMLALLRAGEADVAVGSRYVAGGGFGDWSEERVAISRFATRVGRMATGVDLADPMSGFFALRREVLDAAAPTLSGAGFKILLDILASTGTPLRVREVPYEFRARVAGESKLDEAAVLDFGRLLLDKTVGRYVPTGFLIFALVGGLGFVVHLAVLAAAHQGFAMAFTPSQTIATFAAMTFNFLLNNVTTYRDRRLRGFALLRGWLSFLAVCSIGAAANIGIAAYAFDAIDGQVGFAWIWSAAAGVVVGAVWNYAVSAVYTWGKA